MHKELLSDQRQDNKEDKNVVGEEMGKTRGRLLKGRTGPHMKCTVTLAGRYTQNQQECPLQIPLCQKWKSTRQNLCPAGCSHSDLSLHTPLSNALILVLHTGNKHLCFMTLFHRSTLACSIDCRSHTLCLEQKP